MTASYLRKRKKFSIHDICIDYQAISSMKQ